MTPSRPVVSTSRASRTREAAALGLISVGVVITGPIGLAVGLVLVATSKRWTPSQKMLAVLVPAAVVGMFLLLSGAVGGYTCTQGGAGPEVCEPHAPVFIPVAIFLSTLVVLIAIPVHLFKAAKRP